jgi:hypothetical protein
MRFDARELTIKLLPQQGPHPCPGCSMKTREGGGGCEQTCTSVTVKDCPCIAPSKECNSASCGETADVLGDMKSQAAHQASLGLLRQQLRNVLSQPGAC